jgi:hypothetical protein
MALHDYLDPRSYGFYLILGFGTWEGFVYGKMNNRVKTYGYGAGWDWDRTLFGVRLTGSG